MEVRKDEGTITITKQEAAELIAYISSLRAAAICARVSHPWPGPTVHTLLRKMVDLAGAVLRPKKVEACGF